MESGKLAQRLTVLRQSAVLKRNFSSWQNEYYLKMAKDKAKVDRIVGGMRGIAGGLCVSAIAFAFEAPALGVVGGLAASIAAGGPVGFAAFGSLMGGVYLIGEANSD